jgi:hypothetical protein
MLAMARDESPLPQDQPPREGGVVADTRPPSTLPTSDTHASGGAVSQRSTDFGLGDDRSEEGPDPLLGVDFGGLRIERLIGEGGMGRVYEATQSHPARTVAVKVMRAPAAGAAGVKRFRREADALARLRHPGIAQIFMAGCHRHGIVDVPYYVMEFIPGAEPLVAACRRRSLPVRERLELLLAVSEAVGHGHAAGIVHRDLKPGNILVDAAGNPKIIDFGIARMDSLDGDAPADAPRTETGQFIGTRPYMAPEQFADHRTAIDARTDVHAIGVLMHEVLGGRLPYDVAGKSLVETARIVQQSRPARLVITGLRGADGPLARGAEAIAARCLQKEPADRYSTAAAVADDLRRLLAGEPLAAGVADGPRRLVGLASWGRRRPAVVVAVAALCAACSWGLWRVRSPRASLDRSPAASAASAAVETAASGRGVQSVAGRFATVSSGRTTPLEWVDVSFEDDVFGLGADDFRLTHQGMPVSVDGLTVTGGPRNWRIGGLAALTAEAGAYVLAVAGTERSPVDGSGTVVAVSAEAGWQSPPYREIRFSLLDDDWERDVVSIASAERYTERHAGATTFIRPTVAGREGVVTLRFDLPFTIQDATLTAPLAVWTTGDPFPYDPGARAALDVSADGEAWESVVELKAGAGGFNAAEHDIGRIVAGGRRIWVRVRLIATREWPGDGLIFAQFLRTDPDEKEGGFRLTVTGPHPPVIPPERP